MTGMTLIEGPSAWAGCNVHPEDYRVELSAACPDEIRRAVDELRAFPLPTIVLHPEDFAMPACREQMARVRHILDRGVRFAIVDRLSVAEMDPGEATAIYWLLSSMVSRPVAQKLDGTLIFSTPGKKHCPARECGLTRPISRSAFTTITPTTTRRPTMLACSVCAKR
jgi:hypothetical protein